MKEKGIKPLNIADYPAIKKHLDKYYPELEKRTDKGETPYNLRNCAYIEDFYKQKIVWKRIGSQIRFAYDNDGCFCLDSTCFATGSDIEFLLGYLNSSVSRYSLLNNSPKTGTGDVITSVQALEPLMIPNISEENKKRIISLIREFNSNNRIEEEIDEIIFATCKINEDEKKVIEKCCKQCR